MKNGSPIVFTKASNIVSKLLNLLNCVSFYSDNLSHINLHRAHGLMPLHQINSDWPSKLKPADIQSSFSGKILIKGLLIKKEGSLQILK